MGRNRYLPLIAVVTTVLLFGCGKADKFDEHDQYVGRSGSYVIGVQYGYAVIFKDGEYVVYDIYNPCYSGNYPNLQFSCSFMKLNCTFSDPSTFTAKVTAPGLDLPETIIFHRSDTPLDKDGDGLLDEMYGSAF